MKVCFIRLMIFLHLWSASELCTVTRQLLAARLLEMAKSHPALDAGRILHHILGNWKPEPSGDAGEQGNLFICEGTMKTRVC